MSHAVTHIAIKIGKAIVSKQNVIIPTVISITPFAFGAAIAGVIYGRYKLCKS